MMELNESQKETITILNQVSDKTLSQKAAVKKLVELGSHIQVASEMVFIAGGGSDLVFVDEETGKRIADPTTGR